MGLQRACKHGAVEMEEVLSESCAVTEVGICKAIIRRTRKGRGSTSRSAFSNFFFTLTMY